MEHQQMQNILEKQKAYFIKNGPPSYDLRIDRLEPNEVFGNGKSI
jgi:hypothetical protein